MKIKSMTYEERNKLMKPGLSDLSKSEHDALVKKCQLNSWLKVGGFGFDDDLYLELDYSYSFVRANDLETLELYFEHSNWAIRQGVLYENLAFINQINGGDEWWTLKFDEKNNEWVAFESCTMHCFIEDGSFRQLIKRMLEATIEQCLRFDY